MVKEYDMKLYNEKTDNVIKLTVVSDGILAALEAAEERYYGYVVVDCRFIRNINKLLIDMRGV